MNQNTETWRVWRNKGIGSSDAPIIMNASPHSNLRELFLYKTGKKKKDQGNWATDRGHELEPRIRAYFELKLDIELEPDLFEHYQFDFLRASLDGVNKGKKLFAEFKAPSKEDHILARQGKLPEKYFWQVMHQFAVTGYEVGYYGSYHPDFRPKGALVKCAPDKDAISRLIQREMWFWKLLKQGIDPSLYDPKRLACECAKKPYYGSKEEAEQKIGKRKLFVFRCTPFCGYFHIAKKRMNIKSKNIVDNLVS